jgi:SAM-dependent methyltransferase
MPNTFARWIDSWRFRLFRPGFHVLYHYELRKAGWREAMASDVSIFDGERVLEVQMRQSGIAPILSAALPKARFSVVDLDGEQTEEGSEAITYHNERFNRRSGSFDVVLCSMALHPLPPTGKLALLKEIRRVLRHGGSVFIADIDKPFTAIERRLLRGLAYYFGSHTTAAHLDGTWVELIKQAGFTDVKTLKSKTHFTARITILRARRR